MKPVIVMQTGNGSSNAAILDYFGDADVALQVDVVSGSPNWTVQQTLNNPLDSSVTPTWFNHPDTNMVAQTAARQSNYAFSPLACRIVINSGNGVVRLTAVQAGPPGGR